MAASFKNFSLSVGTAIVALAFLSGCSSSKVRETSGKVAEHLRPSELALELDPSWPTSVDIQYRVYKSPFGTPVASQGVPESWKRQVSQNSQQLRKIVMDEFNVSANHSSRFSRYGIAIAKPGVKAPIMKFWIPSVYSNCAILCTTKARVRVDIYRPEIDRPIWTYLGDFGQASDGAQINEQIFDSLMSDVLGAMERDGLASRR